MSNPRIEEIEAELERLKARKVELTDEWNRLKGEELDAWMQTHIGTPEDLTLESAMGVDLYTLGNFTYGRKWHTIILNYLGGLTRQDQPLEGVKVLDVGPETGGRPTFQIRMQLHRPLDKQTGLLKILPFVAAEDGWKTFEVFNYVSALKRYLRVSEDHATGEVWDFNDLWRATHGGSGRPNFKGPVIEALDHIRTHHP